MMSQDMPSSPRAEEGSVKAIFLGRLQRLIRLRREYREDLNPLGLRLLDRAIDATYRDCVDFGAAEIARPIMAVHQKTVWKSVTDEANGLADDNDKDHLRPTG
jgi:hypothetical protein